MAPQSSRINFPITDNDSNFKKTKHPDGEFEFDSKLFENNKKNNRMLDQNSEQDSLESDRSVIPHSKKWSLEKRIGSIMTALFEHILFCGLTCGWSSIQYVYQQSCYCLPDSPIVYESVSYDFTCDTNELSFENNDTIIDADLTYELEKIVRNAQQLELANILKVALMSFTITGFLWGLLFDKIGSRKFRFLMTLILFTGFLIAFQATKELGWLLYLAMPLIQTGGITIYTTNLKLHTLIPKYQGIIMQFLNGGYEASACTLILAKILFVSYGFSATTFWLIWAIISFPYLMNRTCLLMPKNQIIDEQEITSKNNQKFEELEESLLHVESGKEEIPTDLSTINENKSDDESLEKQATNISEEQDTLPEKTFLQCIKSRSYVLHTFWFVCMDFWNASFFTMFLSWATWLTNSDDDRTSYWVNIWSTIQLVGMPLGIIIGGVYDRVRTIRYNSTKNSRASTLQAIASVTFITTTMGVTASLLSSIRTENLQWVTFIIQLCYRSSLYGNNAQALLSLYPSSQFGKLYGFTFVFTIFSLFSTTYVLEFAQRLDSFAWVNRGYTCLMGLGYVYPIYLVYKSFRV